MFHALATVEVGTEAGVGLPGFGGRAGNASAGLVVGFGGVGGGLGAEEAVVDTAGSAGKASLAGEGLAVVGVPGLTVLVCATTGAPALAVVTADLAVVVDTVTAPLTVVVGATVVVLSFLPPPNNPPKKPLDFFVEVGTGVVVVGLGVVVVVVVVLASFSLPPPNSPPKKPFFLVVVGAGVVVLVVLVDCA